MERTERRLMLILDGAILIFEEAAPSMMAALDKEPELLDAFDLIGSALHWMRKELKKPEQLPHRPDKRPTR